MPDVKKVMVKETRHARSVSFKIEEYIELMNDPPDVLVAVAKNGNVLGRIEKAQLIKKFQHPISAFSEDNFPVYVINL